MNDRKHEYRAIVTTPFTRLGLRFDGDVLTGIIAALLAQVEAGWRPLPLPPEASVGLFEHRDGQQVIDARTLARAQFLLTLEDIDLVIVHHVQGCCRRRWHPGTVSTGQRVFDLGLDHIVHAIRDRPHAFTDLGMASETA